jgi:hypothetical protein
MNTATTNPPIAWLWPRDRSNPFLRDYDRRPAENSPAVPVSEGPARGAEPSRELGFDLAPSVARVVHLPLILLLLLCAFVFVMFQRHEIAVQRRLHFVGESHRVEEARRHETLLAGRIQRAEAARRMALAMLNPAHSRGAKDNRPPSSVAARAHSKSLQGRTPAMSTKAPVKKPSTQRLASRNKTTVKRRS